MSEPHRSPAAAPVAPSRRDRYLGTVLGAAVGDAMGHPTEFIRSFEELVQRYGPSGVTRYEKYWERDGQRFAPYTDDTQMAEIVLCTLLDGHDDLDDTMRRMAAGFAEWRVNPQGGHRAPGMACLSGAERLGRGVPWAEGGGPTAGGCGSVMRCYPFGLVFADDPKKAEEWAVEHSKLTHRDPIALAACAAMSRAVALLVQGRDPDAVLADMVAAAKPHSAATADMIDRAVDEARCGVEPRVTLARLEGWAAHEAVSAAAYIFARHADNPAKAILEGANTPGDSDSLATLAGALTGARCGVEAIPEEWRRDLERSDELIALAGRLGG